MATNYIIIPVLRWCPVWAVHWWWWCCCLVIISSLMALYWWWFPVNNGSRMLRLFGGKWRARRSCLGACLCRRRRGCACSAGESARVSMRKNVATFGRAVVVLLIISAASCASLSRICSVRLLSGPVVASVVDGARLNCRWLPPLSMPLRLIFIDLWGEDEDAWLLQGTGIEGEGYCKGRDLRFARYELVIDNLCWFQCVERQFLQLTLEDRPTITLWFITIDWYSDQCCSCFNIVFYEGTTCVF